MFRKGDVTVKFLGILCLLLVLCQGARAEIIPPEGEGQIGYGAFVLCESLSLRTAPDANAPVVRKLGYGTMFAVQNYENGYWDCFLTENGGCDGWVLEDYIVIDPAWYVTEKGTPVYAWGSLSAKRVGYLATGTRLPVIEIQEDWIVVSLRGASAWIRKTALDREYTQVNG